MKKIGDLDWAETVRNNLYNPQVDQRANTVRQYLGRQVDAQRDGATDSGLAFAFKLKDKYNQGQGLSIPGDDGWMLSPEYLLNKELYLGHFDDTLVLAMMAARDPSNVMSLAATARLSPRARRRDLVGEILVSVGSESKHDKVRQCVEMAASTSFSDDSVNEIKHIIKTTITDIRKEYFDEMKRSLSEVLQAAVDPRDFVETFFELSEKALIRLDIYSAMVHSLIRSTKVRPLVKILMIENIHRMPKKVKYEVVATIQQMGTDPRNHYLKQELMIALEQAERMARENRGNRRAEMVHIFH
ncbi:MAG TPA: hypothetical protein VEB64_07645 [Azospirillaceae bacterium]|nr:hypothetical protein [Azospirillaceae bacterium]